MQKIVGFLLYVLPKNLLSHLTGQFVHLRFPRFIARPMIRAFAKKYAIDLHEAEKPLHEYPSVGEFFVRRLKPGLRPIDKNALIVHPADAVISQSQPITDQPLVQAKGKSFTVAEIIADLGVAEKLMGGWSATYYLCPTDYHRVHSPIDGVVTRVTVQPGKLWPVNEWSVNRIDRLFSINERVVIHIQGEKGLVVVVLVGATNVGKMELSFVSGVSTNPLLKQKAYQVALPESGIQVKKGDELGMFRMGSTVVEFFESSYLVDTMRPKLGAAQMGQAWSMIRGSNR